MKTIYSAILDFISDTDFSRRDEHSATLQGLRESNARIVEGIKDINRAVTLDDLVTSLILISRFRQHAGILLFLDVL